LKVHLKHSEKWDDSKSEQLPVTWIQMGPKNKANHKNPKKSEMIVEGTKYLLGCH
jgi:hypothetical protein